MDKMLTILIIDDSEFNRKMLRDIFKNGYRIIETENGQKAIGVLKKEKIDIIILDIIMPEMNGFQFLKIIKKDEHFRDIPVIVNTQAGDEENECIALDLGADDFIVKPYNPKIIKRRIANIVEKYILKNESMKRKIKDTKERLENLIDTVPGGIGIFEIDDNKIHAVYYNDGLCKMFDYSKDEAERLYSHDVLKSVYPDDVEYILNQIKKMDDKDKIVHSKMRVLNKDGSALWCGITAKRICMDNNKPMFHAVFMDISEEKTIEFKLEKSMKELQFYAERDFLTLVYNRSAFYKYAKDIIVKNKDKKYIIGYWDIDRFKVINELFGGKTGDNILRKISGYLSRITDDIGVYGRLEADHFITCLPEEIIKSSMAKIEKLISGHNNLGSSEYPVMLHVGFYIVDDPNIPVDLMCDRALIALESVKSNYIRRWAYYDEKIKNTLLKEQKLINDTENALIDKQFIIEMQPIYDIKENKLVSAEALVRWNHPVNGLIPPDLFIPLFEKNGFITKLDIFVLEEVCKFLAQNNKAGIKNVPISVNLSRMDFYNKNLCQEIINILEKYKLDHSMIKIEITESAYTDNYNNLHDAVCYFRENGFKVLMDDFGSGYSSLNMIKDIDVDILKIDMKFIDNLDISKKAYGILTTIIEMARVLNMEVVAEGVETFSQYKMLKEMGCDCIQGYYFSKPLRDEEFANLLIKETDKN